MLSRITKRHIRRTILKHQSATKYLRFQFVAIRNFITAGLMNRLKPLTCQSAPGSLRPNDAVTGETQGNVACLLSSIYRVTKGQVSLCSFECYVRLVIRKEDKKRITATAAVCLSMHLKLHMLFSYISLGPPDSGINS